MKYTTTLLLASASIAFAQYEFGPNNEIICTGDPNGAYCAGGSLESNIIIRCTNGTGQAGNCNANLSGYPPYGSSSALCWEVSPTSGVAACEKNCIVECGSGTCKGEIKLGSDVCTPVDVSSTLTTVASTSTAANTTAVTITSTGTSVHVVGFTTLTETFTTTYCPATESTLTTAVVHPTTTPKTTAIPLTTSVYVLSTGTAGTTKSAASNGTITTSATKTPVGPSSTKSTSATFTGAAVANSAGAGLAVVGLFAAYFL